MTIFSAGFKIDKFGCQVSCECDNSLTTGDMTIIEDREVFRSGQSHFVPRKFNSWTDIHLNGKWIIPYETHKKIANNPRGERALRQAFDKLESRTSLKFIKRTDEERYLFFTDGLTCSSHVGQQKKSGPQEIILGSGCYYYFTVIHEVFCLESFNLE